MKKSYLLFLAVSILLVSLTACKPDDAATATVTTTATTQPTTVTQPATEAPTQPTEPKEIHWKKAFYIDEFGDLTDEWYLSGVFHGTFSNSATSGSDLVAAFYFDQNLDSATFDNFRIRLIEYSKHIANLSRYSEDEITIKVKTPDAVYECNPYYIEGDDLYIKRGDKIFAPIIDNLNSNTEISILVETLSGSRYTFKIDGNGLEDIPHHWVGRI